MQSINLKWCNKNTYAQIKFYTCINLLVDVQDFVDSYVVYSSKTVAMDW